MHTKTHCGESALTVIIYAKNSRQELEARYSRQLNYLVHRRALRRVAECIYRQSSLVYDESSTSIFFLGF